MTRPPSPISLVSLVYQRVRVSLTVHFRFLCVSSSPRSELLGKMFDYSSSTMIGLQDTEVHLQRRRPWARAFTSSAVKEYAVLVAKRTRQLVSRLEQQQGVIQLDKWLDYFTSVAPAPPSEMILCSLLWT